MNLTLTLEEEKLQGINKKAINFFKVESQGSTPLKATCWWAGKRKETSEGTKFLGGKRDGPA